MHDLILCTLFLLTWFPIGVCFLRFGWGGRMFLFLCAVLIFTLPKLSIKFADLVGAPVKDPGFSDRLINGGLLFLSFLCLLTLYWVGFRWGRDFFGYFRSGGGKGR